MTSTVWWAPRSGAPERDGVQLRAGERGGGDVAPGLLPAGVRGWLRLHEKGGKRHDEPAYHRAEAVEAYVAAGGLDEAARAPLFRG